MDELIKAYFLDFLMPFPLFNILFHTLKYFIYYFMKFSFIFFMTLFNPHHFQILGGNGLDLKLLVDGTG